jgi:uncharacterized protein (UPF0333 family)
MKKFLLLFILLILPSFSCSAWAENETIPYSVTTVQSERQVDTKKTYFDVQIPAGESEELVVQIHNSSEKSITLEVSVATAKTNTNGVVEYGVYDGKNASSLPFKVEDVMDYPTEVRIPAKETKNVKFKVTMPTEEYTGMIAGGITIQEKHRGMNAAENAMVIKNAYNYQIATILHGKTSAASPDLRFIDSHVDQKNYRNSIFLQLENPTYAYMNNAVFSAVVMKDGKAISLDNASKKSIQIAPASVIDYPLILSDSELESGKYDVELTVECGKDSWLFKESVDVTKSDAKKLNKLDVRSKKHFSISYMILISVILLVVLILLIYLAMNVKTKKSKGKKKAKKRKSRTKL